MYVGNPQASRCQQGFDIGLGGSGWTVGGVSDGTTLWFVLQSPATAFAYAYAATPRPRCQQRCIATFAIGVGLAAYPARRHHALVYRRYRHHLHRRCLQRAALATLQVSGGTTYTTAGDADGMVTAQLTGIADSAPFVMTIGGSGYVEVYPQT